MTFRPRPMPRRPMATCFADCPAQLTEDPADCTCFEETERSYWQAVNQRLAEHKEGER